MSDVAANASPKLSRKRHLSTSAPKKRSSEQSPTLSSTANPAAASENDSRMDRWYKALRTDHGRERLGPLSFASVRKDDKLLVRPCYFKDMCACRKYGSKFVSVETITGYKSHLESKLLDLNDPLPLYCPICPQGRTTFSRNSNFLDHIKKDHLADNVRSLIKSTPPYKCPFYKACRFESKKSTNEVLNHFLDPSDKHGSVNFNKVFLAEFIGSDPRRSVDRDRTHDERKRRSTIDEEIITSTDGDGPSPMKMVKYEDRREINELRTDNQKLSDAVKEYQSKLASMNSENVRLLQRVHEMETSQQDYLDKIASLEKELSMKNDQNNSDELFKNQEELKNLTKKYERVKGKLHAAEADNQKLRSQGREKDSEIAQLQKNEQDIRDLENQLASQVEDKMKIQAQLQELSNDVQRCISQDCQDEKERQIKLSNELTKCIDELNAKCKTAEQDVSSLKEREKALKEELLDLNEEMKCKNETINSIQIQAAKEKKSAQQDIEDLEEKNVNLLRKIGTLSNADEVISELREQIEKKMQDNVNVVLKLSEKSKQVDAKNKKIGELKTIIKFREDEIAFYKTKIESDDDHCNQSDSVVTDTDDPMESKS